MKIESDLSPGLEAFCEFLGFTVMIVSVVFKLPQIYTVVVSGSTDCISLPSIVLEWLSYSLMLVYHFAMAYPLHTYVEHVMSVSQDYLLVLMIMSYRKQLHLKWLPLFMLYNIGFIIICLRWLPDMLLYLLILSTTPMLVWSKCLQFYEILVFKHAGSVSLLTWLLIVYETGVRMFTTALITHDTPMQINLTSSQVLNVSIVAAIIYYSLYPARRRRSSSAVRHRRPPQ